eukprot:7838954-Pyramimonas_sp.AAC.1
MDAGRILFNMWFSPQRHAHAYSNVLTALRVQGGSFSKCGYRVCAAHIRLRVCSSSTHAGQAVFRIWLSP